MQRTQNSRLLYVFAALVLLKIEILIAIFVRDPFVRGYVGDVLAVMLVYAVLRALTPLGVIASVAVSLGIAFAIEIAQALNVLDMVGLRDNTFARVVFGGHFDWLDIIAYLVGGLVVITLRIDAAGEAKPVSVLAPAHRRADTAEMCAKLDINTFFYHSTKKVECWSDDHGDEQTTRHVTAYNGTSEGKLKAWMEAATIVAAKIGGYEE